MTPFSIQSGSQIQTVKLKIHNNGKETMTNPFEDQDGTYRILINAEGQYSLWPDYIDIPAGWTSVQEPRSRESCLEYINEHWTDMRPRSLIKAMRSECDEGRPK
jgi:MbtH protein